MKLAELKTTTCALIATAALAIGWSANDAYAQSRLEDWAGRLTDHLSDHIPGRIDAWAGRIGDGVSDLGGSVAGGVSDIAGRAGNHVSGLVPGSRSWYRESCARGACNVELLVADDIKQMSEAELRYLFCSGNPYPMPIGASTDRAVTRPSNFFISEFVALQWERKVFYPQGVHLNVNHLGRYFGKGSVGVTQSLYAEQACGAGFGQGYAVIVDYSAYSNENSSLESRLRDEFREVAPCFYIGVGMIRDSEMAQQDRDFQYYYNGLRNYQHYNFGVFVALDMRPNGRPTPGVRACQQQ